MCEKHTMMKRQKNIFFISQYIYSKLVQNITHFCLDFSFLADNGNHYLVRELFPYIFFIFSSKLLHLFSYSIFFIYM